jgi:hypothetical protein
VTEREAAVRLLRQAGLHLTADHIEATLRKRCTVCRRVFTALRSDARTCTPRCRKALSRRPRIAHQRRVRDLEAAQHPRQQDTALDYTIEVIGAAEAKEFILRYEFLGTVGRPVARYGARNRQGELVAVALFARPAKPSKAGTIVLERGACAHFAHRHCASWFLRRVTALAHREHG